MLAGALLLLAGAAEAQTLSGRLRAEGGVPVVEALVVLLDSTGAVAARTSTSPSGHFLVRGPAAGTYRLRVLRIGQGPWETEPVTLAAGQTITRELSVPTISIQLPDLIAVAQPSCEVGGDAATAAVVLLDEAGKAFGLAEETFARSRVLFRTTTYETELTPRLAVSRTIQARRSEVRRWPVSSAPVDSLASHGFVRIPRGTAALATGPDAGPVYFGPDAAVLGSEWFRSNHCFRLQSRTPDSAGQLAVEFEPVSTRERPGIAGVVRLDAETLALRSLEFRYVGLPRWVPDNTTGGSLSFARIPNVGWLVTEWWLRAPIPVVSDRRGTELHGFREFGGVVTEMLDRSGTVLARVADSLAATPDPAPPDTVVADGGRIVVVQRNAPGAPGRIVAVRNESPFRVRITNVRLKQCFNVAAACGGNDREILLHPDATVDVLTVRPRKLAEGTSYVVEVEWEPARRE